MADDKEGLEVLLAREAQAFGLDPVALKDQVRRELTLRAAKRIADKVEAEKAANPDADNWIVV